MSQPHYYIQTDGRKDGPHDLITVMRRIRTGKIDRDTPIYAGDAPTPLPAGNIDEIALFFDRRSRSREKTIAAPSTWRLIQSGWQFTSEHHIMTVYAGALLLISLMLGLGLVARLGVLPGLIVTWCVYGVLQSCYLVFALRLYRNQPHGSDFINQHFAPALPALALAAALLALMTAGGTLLLLIPGIAVAVLYCFVPLLIIDKRYRPVEAMQASRLLLIKYAKSYVPVATLLVLLYLFSIVLIVPLPVALPIFASCLAQLYEELAAA